MTSAAVALASSPASAVPAAAPAPSTAGTYVAGGSDASDRYAQAGWAGTGARSPLTRRSLDRRRACAHPASGCPRSLVTITVLSPTATGGLSAWAYGTPRTAATRTSVHAGPASVGPRPRAGVRRRGASTSQRVRAASVAGRRRRVRLLPLRHPERARRLRPGHRRTAWSTPATARTATARACSAPVRDVSPLIGGHDGIPTSPVAAVAVTHHRDVATRSGRVLAHRFTGRAAAELRRCSSSPGGRRRRSRSCRCTGGRIAW